MSLAAPAARLPEDKVCDPDQSYRLQELSVGKLCLCGGWHDQTFLSQTGKTRLSCLVSRPGCWKDESRPVPVAVAVT